MSELFLQTRTSSSSDRVSAARTDERGSTTVSLALQIETPENVVLNYQLAGPAVRITAYIIDFLVRCGLLVAISIFLIVVGISISPYASMGAFLVSMFLLNWGYYIFCEGLFRGKTIGKHAMGLRVIQEQGYPLTFWSAVLRNLLREADALPGLFTGVGFGVYGVGFCSMFLTRNLQRVGDIAARTVVITERSVILPREPIILEKIQPLPHTEIGSYVPPPHFLSMIEQFLGRRFVLTHGRGHGLAGILAGSLAKRLEFRGDRNLVEQYPMAFLARVYVTFLHYQEDKEDEEHPDRLSPGIRRRHLMTTGELA